MVQEGKMVTEEKKSRIEGYSGLLEADVYSRLKETLEQFDGMIDIHAREFKKLISGYFDTLIYLVEETMKRQRSGDDKLLIYCQAVEELYLVGCERVRQDDSYRIYGNHPIMLMNRWLEENTERILAEKAEGTECGILRTVFDAKKRNRRQWKLYSRSAVYETALEQETEEYVTAKSFEQSLENTKIPVIRIWEKIMSYLEHHPDRKGGRIKIAVLGQLVETASERELLNKMLGVEVLLTTLKRKPELGRFFFEDDEQIYDIRDMMDLQMLVNRFDIVLFLDQNCFYSQRQAKKDVREIDEGQHCRWQYNRAQNTGGFRDEITYYQMIYNRIGPWLNSFGDSRVATYEFDRELYNTLEAITKENTDIYLYIRYGKSIGEKKLAYNGICNDEYYDGKMLLVCKISEMKEEDFNEEYKLFLKQTREQDNKNYIVKIKFWKLLKSISNEYYEEILKKWNAKTTDIKEQLLRYFSESYVMIKYELKAESEQVHAECAMSFSEREIPDRESMNEVMCQIAQTVVSYAFNEKQCYCMNRYFEWLMIYSIISNANDLGDLVFAHFLATNLYRAKVEFVSEITVGDGEEKFSGCKDKYIVRKNAYAIIQQLEKLRMRSEPDMEAYFLGTFRARVCQNVAPENVRETFKLIEEYCERFQYTDGYLYTNSRLI